MIILKVVAGRTDHVGGPYAACKTPVWDPCSKQYIYLSRFALDTAALLGGNEFLVAQVLIQKTNTWRWRAQKVRAFKKLQMYLSVFVKWSSFEVLSSLKLVVWLQIYEDRCQQTSFNVKERSTLEWALSRLWRGQVTTLINVAFFRTRVLSFLVGIFYFFTQWNFKINSCCRVLRKSGESWNA